MHKQEIDSYELKNTPPLLVITPLLLIHRIFTKFHNNDAILVLHFPAEIYPTDLKKGDKNHYTEKYMFKNTDVCQKKKKSKSKTKHE